MILQLKEVLKKYIDENLGISRLSEELKITSAWGKLGSLSAFEHATPEKLVGGVLYLNVKDSAWAQQIYLMKPDILSRLNETLGEGAVADIRLRTGFAEGKKGEAAGRLLTRTCGLCNVGFYGTEEFCPICSREKKQKAFIGLYRLADKNPKLTFSDAKREVPELRDIEFRRIKRDVNARKREKLEPKWKYYGKGKSN